MSGVDVDVLARFVSLAGERLKGDWVVIGGCVLPLLGVRYRVTADIDIAGPDGAGMDQVLVLMEIAEEVGLSVAAINQAGAHFLRRVEGWAEHLLPILRGTTATIHVPDATLYLLLKLGRLTETDLLDCERMLELTRHSQSPFQPERVRGTIRKALQAGPPAERKKRLERLLGQLEADGPRPAR